MDFFQNQDAARRRTGWLVAALAASVVAIVAAIYLVVSALFFGAGAGGVDGSLPRWWDPERLLMVSGATLIVVSAGSLYKTALLARGGGVVAESLGGRLVPRETSDPGERRLLNVVDEMALASGLPVPPVYVMDQEEGINAFAAGLTPQTAVVAVTRGTLQQLNRDELQGVMGHEFSHILNGDMRLNLRLMGILHGLLLISLIGSVLLRSTQNRVVVLGARSDDRRNDAGGRAAIALLGLALYILGYVGVLCGHLIKAAVSRQREFLADASAVQFTRNPDGLVGALKKIGGLSQRGRIHSVRAEEASHLFFANAMSASWVGWLATHPPLEERIRRLDPASGVALRETRAEEQQSAAASSLGAAALAAPLAAATGRARADRASEDAELPRSLLREIPVVPARLVERVGRPGVGDLREADRMLRRLGEPVKELTRDPCGAFALLCGLLLDRDPTQRRRQMTSLAERIPEEVMEELSREDEAIQAVPDGLRLPLVQLAVPSLRLLSRPQYRELRSDLVKTVPLLVRADGQVSLFEFALEHVALTSVAEQSAHVREAGGSEIAQVAATRRLLTVTARAGKSGEAASAESLKELGGGSVVAAAVKLGPAAPGDCGPQAMREALNTLAAATGDVRRDVLEASVRLVARDNRVTPGEADLLRLIAWSLDCPVPALLAESV